MRCSTDQTVYATNKKLMIALKYVLVFIKFIFQVEKNALGF